MRRRSGDHLPLAYLLAQTSLVANERGDCGLVSIARLSRACERRAEKLVNRVTFRQSSQVGDGRMKKLTVIVASLAVLAACASSPNQIAATYVSPLVYQGFDCDQMRAEGARINARVAEVTGQQQAAANNDAAMMGVGLVLFWPALFFLQGDKTKSTELARLKGESDALQQAYIQKSCGAAQTVPAAAPVPKT